LDAAGLENVDFYIGPLEIDPLEIVGTLDTGPIETTALEKDVLETDGLDAIDVVLFCQIDLARGAASSVVTTKFHLTNSLNILTSSHFRNSNLR